MTSEPTNQERANVERNLDRLEEITLELNTVDRAKAEHQSIRSEDRVVYGLLDEHEAWLRTERSELRAEIADLAGPEQ